MVVNAADGDGLAIELHEDAAEIGVKFSAEIGVTKERTAVFRGENGVDENLRQRLWHIATMIVGGKSFKSTIRLSPAV